MWTAIVVTCAVPSHVESVAKELETLRKVGKIGNETITLAIEDPGEKIGSGSATINGLLVIAEHLSVKRGYQVITADVIHQERILMFHHGRGYPFDPCGKAFLTLPVPPAVDDDESNQSVARLVSNLDNLLDCVTRLCNQVGPGVWVCSSDMLLVASEGYSTKFCDGTLERDCDVILFSTLETIEYATNHGVIRMNDDGSVKNILYAAPQLDLEKLTVDQDRVALVAGLVYFSSQFAESLLSLHTVAPVDCCTYMGSDNGCRLLQISLFFDILFTMVTDATEEGYVFGSYCKKYNLKHGYNDLLLNSTQYARRLVWNELRKYKMKTHILSNIRHKYWSEFNAVDQHSSTLLAFSKFSNIHSYIHKCEKFSHKPCLVINSYLTNCILGSNTVIQHCVIRGTDHSPFNIGNNCYLVGVNTVVESESMLLGDKLALIETFAYLNGEHQPINIRVLFGVNDLLHVPYSLENATFCNIPWNQFFQRTGITPNELWTVTNNENLCLWTAKLFPKTYELKHILWMQNSENATQEQITQWRQSDRFSLQQIVANSSLTENLNRKNNVFGLVMQELIISTLIDNRSCSLLPYFNYTVLEKRYSALLNILDTVGEKFRPVSWEPGKTARVLANIADLLGCMAGKNGGLRSGPAANTAWSNAFSLLDSNNETDIARGVKELRLVRKNWLDTPTKLIRAARHYEGAAQILIKRAVMTSKQFVRLIPSTMPRFEKWIVAECPARVDLQGGWSDTPPICYELGGSVLNVALLINGEKPIGAKARLIKEPRIELLVQRSEDSSNRIVVRNLENLIDYRQLAAAGALLKAAVIIAEVVNPDLNSDLQTQLMSKYGGGIEIQTWSRLPEGSGLGTSSILASAVLAVLWKITGKTWTKSDLIHTVLHLEQLLTTGGGWQDQVAGVNGGINFAHSGPQLPLQVKTESLLVNDVFREKFNQHLVLAYTGKVRLAKYLLQNVIRNWYARDDGIVRCFEELVENGRKCRLAFEEENLEKIGQLMNRYWQQKLVIAPGCDPAIINSMMSSVDHLVYGQTLAGAGGGGFIVMLTKQPNIHAQIQSILHSIEKKVILYPASIDLTGITLTGEI